MTLGGFMEPKECGTDLAGLASWDGMWVMGLISEVWRGHSGGEHLPTQNTPCAVSDQGMWGLCWPGGLCCLRDK